MLRFARLPMRTLLTMTLALSFVSSVMAATCESFASLSLPQTVIYHATTVAAGAFRTPPNPTQQPWAGSAEVPPEKLPAFCEVAMTISPVPDSEIRVELTLPLTGWNGKFLVVGNGGTAGQVNWRAMSGPLSRGYAVASTDTGHSSTVNGDTSWALGHPQKVIDHAWRSVHETTVKSKLVIAAFYGRPPRFSYFNGSSTGGRQGLTEAQRFPEDFDGIVVGAADYSRHIDLGQFFAAPAAIRDKAATPLSPAKAALLNNAVLKACDTLDGVRDGVIENPMKCHFDPGALRCKDDAGASDCLTGGEVTMARVMYGPVANSLTKAAITPGYAAGSELNWRYEGERVPGTYVARMLLQKPQLDHPFNFGSDVEMLDKADAEGPRTNATDPNLTPFFQRGGKLLQVHGWADPQIPSLNSIEYYESVLKTMGDTPKTRDSYRLFMVPGMYHSRGGVGINDFDSIAVMEEWREQGKAPDRIEGRRVVDGKTARTRPLCPWPQVAVYSGAGSTDESANFACKVK